MSALRSGRSPCCHGFPRSHVLLAHARRRGRFCVCVGVAAGLVVGVFARWVVGCGVFAWGVCAFGVGVRVGARGSFCFGCPCLVVCLALTRRVWGGFGVCRVGRVPGGACDGAGQSCPAPTVWLRPLMRAPGGGCSRGGERAFLL